MSTDIVLLNSPEFEASEEIPSPPSDAQHRGGPTNGRAAPLIATFPLTDLGNAERLVHRHGNDLRHTRSRGWLAWDGRRWATDETGEVMRRAKGTVRAMYPEAAMLPDKHERETLAGHAIDSEDVARLNAMVKLAETEPEIAITPAKLDTNPWLLNVLNGTLDLQTGKLSAHRREDLITKLAPVSYDPRATCPRFMQFLTEVQPCIALRAYLKRLSGYGATGVIREHVLPVFYGVGRNGKGVFTNTVQHVFGDYALTVPAELLMAKQNPDHPTGLSDLFGCRLAVAAETEQNRGLATALVKQLTGGDPIAARRMHKDFFRFLPTHKLLLSTNHRPVIKETKDAIWDRVHLIPWEVRFPPDKQDKELGEKLRAEASGILSWIVEGCLEWQRLGLAPPPRVVAATAQYREDMDQLGDFLTECCVLEAGARVARPTLRNAYELWARDIGLRFPLDPKGFAESLRERGCTELTSMREPGRPKPVRGWEGIRLRTDDDNPDENEKKNGSKNGNRNDDVDTYAGVDADPGNPSKNTRYETSSPKTASTHDYVSTPPAPGPASEADEGVGAAEGPAEREEFEL